MDANHPDVDLTPAAPAAGGARSGHYGAAVEYGLHCAVFLVHPRDHPASSRDLAEFQGLPPTLVAKIMPRLEKAGIVSSSGGINGGYRLARDPEGISVLGVVDAIEGDKRLFDCREVRQNCILFDGEPPGWSARGVCGIHGVFLRAQKAMRQELARTSLLDLAQGIRAPAGFGAATGEWLDARSESREARRIAAVRRRGRTAPDA